MAILKTIFDGGPVLWLFVLLAVALLALAGPKLVPLIKAWRGVEKVAPKESPTVDDLPSAWLEKMREEARHSASNAVGGPILRIDVLEKRHAELRAMVDELQPFRVTVGKLETAVSFMREEQSELRKDVNGLREDMTSGHEKILDALAKIASEREQQ